jgi:hypothetical protein
MITMTAFAAIQRLMAGFHYFNELLVQFFFEGQLRQAVPDNMVILGKLEDRVRGSYAPDVDGIVPFWVLEYVSPSSRRKDYVENMRVYEALRAPYYLIFDPERQDLRLFRINGRYYQRLPGENGRLSLPEIEVEVALLDGWARFWYRGELLCLPGEDYIHLRQERQARDDAERQIEAAASALRPLVEARAKAAGRPDILAGLPAITDAAALARLLAELGPGP